MAGLTLTPGEPSMATGPFLCIPCGEVGTADGILNVGLFVPLGALLGVAGAGPGLVAGLAFVVSGAIEAVQMFLPGRFPTAADMAFNTLGAVVGFAGSRGLLSGAVRPGGVALWAGGTLVATALLTLPAAPSGELYGQHTPELGGVPPYGGEVLAARVGEVSVPSHRVADGDALRQALETGIVEVRFRVAPEGQADGDRRAILFAVFSGDQREGVSVTLHGDRVAVRLRTVAAPLRFHRPSAVLTGGLAGAEPGGLWTIDSEPRSGGRCIETPGRRGCGLGVGPTEGWRYLVDADGWPPWLGLLVSMVWVGLPAAALARAHRRGRGAIPVGAALLISAVILPTLTPLAGVRWWPLLGGVSLGGAFGWTLDR